MVEDRKHQIFKMYNFKKNKSLFIATKFLYTRAQQKEKIHLTSLANTSIIQYTEWPWYVTVEQLILSSWSWKLLLQFARLCSKPWIMKLRLQQTQNECDETNLTYRTFKPLMEKQTTKLNVWRPQKKTRLPTWIGQHQLRCLNNPPSS